MADMFSDYKTPQGRPQLEKDYWQGQKQTDRNESVNLFDDLIKTNFDPKTLERLSVFGAKKK